jgi:hypothetical protein
MDFGPLNDRTYARCRVTKDRWFWVVFESLIHQIEKYSDLYGYESTAAAAEARARREAGPGARKTIPRAAAAFLEALRLGTANPSWHPPWCDTLGLTLPCGIDDVKAAYRRLAKAAHPDTGGNADDFMAIESAYREALAYHDRSGSPLEW